MMTYTEIINTGKCLTHNVIFFFGSTVFQHSVVYFLCEIKVKDMSMRVRDQKNYSTLRTKKLAQKRTAARSLEKNCEL